MVRSQWIPGLWLLQANIQSHRSCVRIDLNTLQHAMKTGKNLRQNDAAAVLDATETTTHVYNASAASPDTWTDS